MSNGHADRGPSGASRWLNCTASPGLIERLKAQGTIEEGEDSFPSREGTYAHAVMESMILNNCAVRMTSEEFKRNLKAAEAQVLEGQDEFDIEQIVDDLDGLLQHVYQLAILFPDLQVYVEEKVSLMPITADVWGTADLILYSPEGSYLQVLDLKYGRIYVNEVANPQATLYFMGALLSTLKGQPFPENASIAIYQPRGGGAHLREWEVTADYIKGFLAGSLEPALIEYAEGGTFRPGNPCEYCPALLHCQAARNHMLEIAQMSFDDVDTAEAEADHIAQILDAEKMVLKLIEAAKGHALTTLTLGGEVPGYKLVEARTNRRWGKPDEEVIDFLRTKGKMKLKDVQVKKLISLGAAEKLAKASKHIDVEDLQAYIKKPAGANVIAPASDRRTAITVAAFQPLTDNTEEK